MRFGIRPARSVSTRSRYVLVRMKPICCSFIMLCTQPMYYRNAQAAVVVYDVTKASSLEKAKTWVKELQRQANPNIVIALAGNKIDLVTSSGSSSSTPESEDEADDATATPGETAASGEPESLRQVPRDEAEAYAQEAGLLFFETSAKTGEGVVEIFTEIGKRSHVLVGRRCAHLPIPLLHDPYSNLHSQEDPHRPDSGFDSRRSASGRRIRSCCPGGRCQSGGEQREGQGCVQLLIFAAPACTRDRVPPLYPAPPITSSNAFLPYHLPPPFSLRPSDLYALSPVHVLAVVLERHGLTYHLLMLSTHMPQRVLQEIRGCQDSRGQYSRLLAFCNASTCILACPRAGVEGPRGRQRRGKGTGDQPKMSTARCATEHRVVASSPSA